MEPAPEKIRILIIDDQLVVRENSAGRARYR
jgi:hypothetical protein